MSCSIGPDFLSRDSKPPSGRGKMGGPIVPAPPPGTAFRGPGKPSSLADAVRESASPTAIDTEAPPVMFTDGGLFTTPLGPRLPPPPIARLDTHTPPSISHTGSSEPTAVDVRPLWVVVHTSSWLPKSAGTFTENTNCC